MRGKKHCVICKKRFRPDPRVAKRQKCCGARACSRARHLATKAAAYERDKFDIADERLVRSLVRPEAVAPVVAADPADLTRVSATNSPSSPTIAPDRVISGSYAQVSWQVVSSAIGRKSAVVLKTLAKVAGSAVSSEIDAKLRGASEVYAKVGHRRVSSQFVRARSTA